MLEHSVVGVYKTLAEAETAVRSLNEGGFPIQKVSIVAQHLEDDRRVHGFVTSCDVAKPAPVTGAWVGGIFGILIGAAFLWVPGVGPLVVAGSLASMLLGGAEGAIAGRLVFGAHPSFVIPALQVSVTHATVLFVLLFYPILGALVGLFSVIYIRSIYAFELFRRGHDIPAALQANFYHLRKTRDIMDTRFLALPADGSTDDFSRIVLERPEISCFVMEGPQGLIGFLDRAAALAASSRPEKPATVADMADRGFVTAGPDTPLLDVMAATHAAGAPETIVIDRAGKAPGSGISGVIAKHDIASAVMEGMELFQA